MNSNPSFYPKHLARQYVQQWNGNGEAMTSQQVAPAPVPTAMNFNGHDQRSVTPVGNVSGVSSSSPCSFNMSPTLETRSPLESNRKILEGLPDTFITAMKQLFTLLDLENTGHVHIEDIAEHWSTDAAGAILPPNIVPSLRKVTTPEGFLTFERFCAGLKIAILRHSAQRHRQADTDSSESSMDQSDHSGSGEGLASSSASSSPLSRTSSMPNLQQSLKASSSSIPIEAKIMEDKKEEAVQGPPKPPRDPNRLSMLDIHSRDIAGGSTSSLPAAIIKQSKNAEPEFIWKPPPPPFVSKHYQRSEKHFTNRRHTLQGGIDLDKVSKAENLEDKKKTLAQGLVLLDKGRQWFEAQLERVENMLNNEEEREITKFNMNSVHDLNSRLSNLLQNSSLDEEPSGNNAKPANNQNFELLRRIERLQEQNRMLTSEISRQSNRVTALEHDKRSLIKQLFQQAPSSLSCQSNASTLR